MQETTPARRTLPCVEGRAEHEWLNPDKWAAVAGSDGRTRTQHVCPHCLVERTESWKFTDSVTTLYQRLPNDALALPDRIVRARAKLGIPTPNEDILADRYRPSTPYEREVCVF